MKPEAKYFSTTLGGKEVTFETGRIARQAGGSVILRQGDSMMFGKSKKLLGVVGALMVGKIKNHISSGKIERCKEKGMFLFGGSTIILLCDKNAVEIDETFFTNTNNNKETIVKMGQVIGKKR